MSKYDTTLFQYFQNLKNQIRLSPLNLGGTAASSGGPPGGFVGYLPQSRVGYDEEEAESLGFSDPNAYNSSGVLISASLVDNLNHIRYRIAAVEGLVAASGTLSIYDDDELILTGVTVLNFTDDITATETGPGEVTISVVATGIIITDEKVKVSSNDTTSNYLENKLTAGSNINISVLNEGSNENLRISASTGATTFVGLTDTPSSYTGQSGKYPRVNSTENGLEFTTVSSGVTTFVGLTDTPSSYTDQAGKYPRVNVTENGLEFVTISGGGANSFIDLSDTPSSYTGQAGKYPRVNISETGLEFTTVSGSGNSIIVKDEGNILTTELESMNFVGPGVTATTSGNNVTVTISGSAIEASFVGAKVYRNSNFQLSTSTGWQEISWESSEYESDSTMWSSGAVVYVRESGYYSAIGQATISGNIPTNERIQLGLFKNYNTFLVGIYDGYYVTTSGARTLQVLWQGNLSKDENLNIKILNGEGTQPYVLGNPENTFLQIHKIHGFVQAQEENPKIVNTYLTGYISVNNETETPITWSAENYDTDSMWSSGSQIQINTPGYYHVDASCVWEDLNNHGNIPFQVKIGIRLNGSTMIAQKWEWHDVDTDGDRTEGLSTPISCDTPYLDDDDYLEVVVWHSKGSTASNIIRPPAYNTYCMVHKIQ